MTIFIGLSLVFLLSVGLRAAGFRFSDFSHSHEGDQCIFPTGDQGQCLEQSQCRSLPQGYNPLAFPDICADSHGYDARQVLVCCPFTTEPSLSENFSVTLPPTTSFKCGSVVKPRANLALNRHFAGGWGNPWFRRLPSDGDRFLRIVGGTPSTRHSWPWMAILGRRENSGEILWFCGAILVSPQWVLTAMHCVLNPRAFFVRLGEYDLELGMTQPPPQDISVSKLVPYPEFKLKQGYHDLALLRLQRPVVLTNFISPVCMPWEHHSMVLNLGTSVVITGWGSQVYGGQRSSVLREAKVQVWDTRECNEAYKKVPGYKVMWPDGIRNNTLFCAGDSNGGKDACQGDSGGPVVYETSPEKYILVGIISKGLGCGNVRYPGIYVSLLYQPYLQWIRDIAF